VLIVTSTYNGAPPDNAARFVRWVEDTSLAPDLLQGVTFAVLGCGNKQWRGTFQRIPRLLHARLQALGARPLCALGECDADGDFDAAAEAWTALFTDALLKGHGARTTPPADDGDALLYEVELANFAGSLPSSTLPEKFPLHGAARLATVTRNDELQSLEAGRSTRHIEVSLPEGVTYRAGDHLGVFPENAPDVVEAVAARCGMRVSDVVVVRERPGASSQSTLPCGVPVTVGDLLRVHVDLTGALTRRELRVLAATSPCPPERLKLEALAGEATFRTDVYDARMNVLDVLGRFPSVECSLALLLSLRPILKPRYYSIASSPRVTARACTVTVGVHTCPRADGTPHEGVCSHYLARIPAGSTVRVVVKDTGSTFRLPPDATRDVLLIGPGTGFAPMRGFIEERAALRREGKPVGHTFLYFGCRHPAHDWIYRREMESWRHDGALDGLYVAFSREPERPKVYVQDLLRQNSAEVFRALENGASVYVCGDAKRMAPDVQKALTEIIEREGKVTRAEAEARIETLKAEGRYLQDVWAAG
jgi:cytochrome P450/NADPH-cytochrome P450 reductase